MSSALVALRTARPGRTRCRHQPGADYEALRASIADRGILVAARDHPRRRRAGRTPTAPGRPRARPCRGAGADCRSRGRARVHVLRVALMRRQLSASQRAALGLELVDYEAKKQAALARSRQNLRQTGPRGQRCPLEGRTRDQVAKLAGASARTVQDATTVQGHDPDLFERVKAGQHPRRRAPPAASAKHSSARAPTPTRSMPEGPFELIYADPPWQLGNPDGAYAPENHYPTMPLEEIKQLAGARSRGRRALSLGGQLPAARRRSR